MSDEAKFQGPDDSEPTLERQATLRAAYKANIAADKAPYSGVKIGTRGELKWVVREQSWNGSTYVGAVASTELGQEVLGTIDLREADLQNAVLRGADLWGARLHRAILIGTDLSEANLALSDMTESDARGANLQRAVLFRARLRTINLFEANLSNANCDEADLTDAELRRANLRNTILWGVNLSGTRLSESDLSGADLRDARMDYLTRLQDVKLSTDTWLGDIAWNGALMTRIDWTQAPRLGDERAEAGKYMRQRSTMALRDAARAYRGLAIALRGQGLATAALQFRKHEQRLERQALLWELRFGSWLFSWALNLISGYGDAPGRALACYIGVVSFFAAAYWAITNSYFVFITSHSTHLHWYEALVLSISSFHGRGFFPSMLSLGDPVAIVAAAEAIIGLFIELVFIATFTQRFFAR